MKFIKLIAVLVILAGCANEHTDPIMVVDAWARENIPPRKNTTAYLTIHNHSSSDLSLVAVDSDAAEISELHSMSMDGEIMKMRKADEITIPANGELVLKPEGYHIMLTQLKRDVKDSETISIALQFSNGSRKTVNARVMSAKSAVARGSNQHDGH